MYSATYNIRQIISCFEIWINKQPWACAVITLETCLVKTSLCTKNSSAFDQAGSMNTCTLYTFGILLAHHSLYLQSTMLLIINKI